MYVHVYGSLNVSLWGFFFGGLGVYVYMHIHMYTYIYIYVCVCVCVTEP